MGEFFKGWRPKVGCVTLVMACAAFGMAMRSRVVSDFYEISIGDREHCFGSYHGYLSWRSWDGSWGRSTGWQSVPANMIPLERLLDLESEAVASSHPRQWVIPQLWVIGGLTLLAAGLLLWKPNIQRKDHARG
jgi:hypothetical protein